LNSTTPCLNLRPRLVAMARSSVMRSCRFSTA
jgi:hypothetical protein